MRERDAGAPRFERPPEASTDALSSTVESGDPASSAAGIGWLSSTRETPTSFATSSGQWRAVIEVLPPGQRLEQLGQLLGTRHIGIEQQWNDTDAGSAQAFDDLLADPVVRQVWNGVDPACR